MLAMFGVGMVPLAWYTAEELGMSQWACHLTALMVLFGEQVLLVRKGNVINLPFRCGLAHYLTFHSSRLDAVVLYVPYRFVFDKVPQRTVPVILIHDESSLCCFLIYFSSAPSPLTGGFGFYSPGFP